jgi:hypothetical protein
MTSRVWDVKKMREFERATISSTYGMKTSYLGIVAGGKGLKKDEGKVRWRYFPYDALREVARVLEKGAEKYAPNNWLLVEDARNLYFDAAMRHLTTWFFDGERDDAEFGTHHLANAACCVLFLLAMDLRGAFGVERKCDR